MLLDIFTDEGLKGISYAQGFHANGCKAIQSCLDLLMISIIGEDPSHIEKMWLQMWQSIKLLGRQGLAAFALSMVDIALWDIFGKAGNQPVYRLFGGHRTSLEAYASDALWLVTPVEAAKQAEDLVNEGFTSIKMRFGRKVEREDIQAIAEIRKAVGDHIEIVGDANQGWTRAHTASMCKQLADYHLGWLEEPIDADDIEGYTELGRQFQMPIATGENLYAVRAFHHFLQSRAAAVYTPDLQRIGGLSGWKRIASLLETFNANFSLHLFPEFSSHLLAAANPNLSRKLEWVSWAEQLFLEPLECKNGIVQVPDKPGFGMSWDEAAVRKFSI